MWLVPALILMVVCAGSSIPMGMWILITSRWPSWLRGWMRWPLGNQLSPQVVRLQGWSYVFVGSASAVLAVLLAAFPSLLASPTWPVRWIVWITLAVAVALMLGGVVPYLRSLRLSRI